MKRYLVLRQQFVMFILNKNNTLKRCVLQPVGNNKSAVSTECSYSSAVCCK